MIQNMQIPINERVIIALDVDTISEAKRWVNRLKGQATFFKVGWQLFIRGSLNIVEWIIKNNLKVMLDLKFFDIANTVEAAIRNLKDTGITFATVHGTDTILKAAVNGKNDMKIISVTAMTSFDDSDLRQLGLECSIEELVISRTKRALEIGCEGVVASGLEARKIREKFGQNCIIITPGVRPVRNQRDDQKRIVSVAEAILNGVDYIVMGRPILNASDPNAMLENIKKEIYQALQYIAKER
jgi:orotidine-5'-phosphate decarboxylase